MSGLTFASRWLASLLTICAVTAQPVMAAGTPCRQACCASDRAQRKACCRPPATVKPASCCHESTGKDCATCVPTPSQPCECVKNAEFPATPVQRAAFAAALRVSAETPDAFAAGSATSGIPVQRMQCGDRNRAACGPDSHRRLAERALIGVWRA